MRLPARRNRRQTGKSAASTSSKTCNNNNTTARERIKKKNDTRHEQVQTSIADNEKTKRRVVVKKNRKKRRSNASRWSPFVMTKRIICPILSNMRRKYAHTLHVSCVILSYWFISISMVYLNKILMSSSSVSATIITKNTPLFVTWFQCLVTSIICSLFGIIGKRVRAKHLQLQLIQAEHFLKRTQSSSSLVSYSEDSISDGNYTDYENNKNNNDNNNNRNGYYHDGYNNGKEEEQKGDESTLMMNRIFESKEISQPSFFLQFPVPEYRYDVAKRLLPLSFIYLGMVLCSNICLNLVQVSFYNVARSLTVIFNYLLSSCAFVKMMSSRTSSSTQSSLLSTKQLSYKILFCFLTVIFGFFIGIYGETNFSLIGTIFGVFSSLFISLNIIFTKQALPVVDNDHWRLTLYNNISVCLLLLPVMLIFDRLELNLDTALSFSPPPPPSSTSILEKYSVIEYSFSNNFHYWMAMIITSIFAFSFSTVTVLHIKTTSPLTHSTSGTMKAAVQSILAFYIWGVSIYYSLTCLWCFVTVSFSSLLPNQQAFSLVYKLTFTPERMSQQ